MTRSLHPLVAAARLFRAAFEQFLTEVRPALEFLADDTVRRYGLSRADRDALIAAAEERLWEKRDQFRNARNPSVLARRIARQAMDAVAVGELLPDDQRLKLQARSRARRKSGAS